MTAPRWTVPPEVIGAHLDGEAVLLHVETKRYYRLNATGSVIWRAIEEGLDDAAIVARLRAAFDVSEADATAALHALREDLAAHALLESGA